jgi:hypothetical protein
LRATTEGRNIIFALSIMPVAISTGMPRATPNTARRKRASNGATVAMAILSRLSLRMKQQVATRI